jgi:alpha-D-ribose 1-methylphosphonate 5-triphosphate synthase subunit PhnH
MSDGLSAGFADPVRDAQCCFRAVLDAMARPGSVRAVTGPTAPAPLDVATAAIVLTLLDHETRVWLDPAMAAARDWMAFHTGAPWVACPRDAAFVVSGALPGADRLDPGGHETPEASTTVILQLASLGTGCRYRLAGPGLREPAVLMAGGLGPDFISWWHGNRALFPRGIDLILCAGNQVAALPRTVMIEEA